MEFVPSSLSLQNLDVNQFLKKQSALQTINANTMRMVIVLYTFHVFTVMSEGCSTNGESFIDAVLSEDPDLEEQIRAIDDSCSEFSTQAECEA